MTPMFVNCLGVAVLSLVWIQELKFSRVTSVVRMLTRRTKHELIIKLIAQE